VANDQWQTPQELFDEVHNRYRFTLDGAADSHNHKLSRWFGPGGIREDSLSDPWPPEERIWCNPPYSRGKQRKFVLQARDHATNGGLSVLLLPADTSTRLFHELIWRRYHVEFLPKRLRFVGASSAAKFGSMLVEFNLLNVV
jgi:phage N-6-adenine-methyltransferase